MPVILRNQINELLKQIQGGDISPFYLLIGGRFLCQQTADRLSEALCGKSGTVHTIDGDTENINSTLSRLRSFSLLPGNQVYRVNNSRLFHSKKVAKSLWNRAVKAWNDDKAEQAAGYLRAMMEAGGLDSADPEDDPGGLSATRWKKCFTFAKPAEKLAWTRELLAQSRDGIPAKAKTTAGDPTEMVQTVLEAGIPETSILLLLAEEVDKRKKFYKFIKDKFTVIDLSVDSGISARAKKVQESVLWELVNATLKKMGKSMAPAVGKQLFERVGFYPDAVVMETEKLALYAGDRDQITINDLNTMVGRTRQEALFELTQAIGDKQLAQGLLILNRLLDNGMHGLAVLATLRNFTRTLLLFRTLQDQQKYGIRGNMPSKLFEERIPGLRENEQWEKELKGHPFALYMRFKTASGFQITTLIRWQRLLLGAEMRLKGSPIKADTVLQHLIISMLTAPV